MDWEGLGLERLITERRSEISINIDRMSIEEILKVINLEDKKVAFAVEKELPNIAKAAEFIIKSLSDGGKVFYIGAGTSGRLGVLDSAEWPPTFGTDPSLCQAIIAGGEKAVFRSVEGAEDDEKAGVEELMRRGLTCKDVVIGLSASGRSPFVVRALDKARRIGAKTIAVTCNPKSEVARVSDITIAPIVGPEVITGSTRMKAGTAEKMVLNMLSTASMVKLGRVHGNLMVSLKPVSGKLVDRAKRIIMIMAGLDYGKAGEVMEKAGGDVKAAILMAKKNISLEEALEMLARSDGSLRKALEEN